MTERHKHTFQFSGAAISKAAEAEAEYHDGRANWWKREQAAATTKLREATVSISEHEVTGGKHVTAALSVDPHAQARANECAGKVTSHQRAGDRFRIEAGAYGTHKETAYSLDADDVIYFRLAGGARDE